MALRIVNGIHPQGQMGVLTLHADYYGREWGFGPYFQTKVADESRAFFQRYRPETDRAWFVVDDEAIVGSLVVDGSAPGTDPNEAHLRWFILDERCRGKGVGNDLMSRAMTFADNRPFSRVYLTTFAGLDAARALYERHGYRLCEERKDITWGVSVKEQVFERTRETAGLVERNM